MEGQSTTIPPRRLGGLLDETFVVYGRQFWRFIGLAAIVAGPISLLSLVLFLALDGGTTAFILTQLLRLIGILGVLSAGAFGVGQHYVSGGITIRDCYTRAWWKIVSLLMMTIVIASAFAAVFTLFGVLLALVISNETILVVLAALALLMLLAAGTFSIIAINAVVVEGYKAVGALKRSLSLIRGSWSDVPGFTAVLALVALGLSILVILPFAIAPAVLGVDTTSVISDAIRSVGGLAVQIAVLPVLCIGGTLLYYDIRVKKEKYDLAALSREMSTASV